MYSEVRRLDALRTVRTAHSGADFESGEVYRRGGLNEEAPGVDAVDGREPEQSTWSDGHINYANESGRRHRLAGTWHRSSAESRVRVTVVHRGGEGAHGRSRRPGHTMRCVHDETGS